jgi:hypothetical protein
MSERRDAMRLLQIPRKPAAETRNKRNLKFRENKPVVTPITLAIT